MLFKVYGADVQLAEIDVARLAKMSTYLYAMISTLARANRSYCDGHAHGALEVKMACTYISIMDPIVMQMVDYCCSNSTIADKVDPFVKNIADSNIDQGCYASVHPLTKTMF